MRMKVKMTMTMTRNTVAAVSDLLAIRQSLYIGTLLTQSSVILRCFYTKEKKSSNAYGSLAKMSRLGMQ